MPSEQHLFETKDIQNVWAFRRNRDGCLVAPNPLESPNAIVVRTKDHRLYTFDPSPHTIKDFGFVLYRGNYFISSVSWMFQIATPSEREVVEKWLGMEV